MATDQNDHHDDHHDDHDDGHDDHHDDHDDDHDDHDDGHADHHDDHDDHHGRFQSVDLLNLLGGLFSGYVVRLHFAPAHFMVCRWGGEAPCPFHSSLGGGGDAPCPFHR